MPDETIGREEPEQRSVGQRLKGSVEKHVLVPLAVTVVSAATHYLIKKLPLLIEEKVLPRLREQGRPETVREVVAETAAVVGEAAAEIVPSVGDGAGAGAGEGAGDGDAKPAKRRQAAGDKGAGDKREQERKQREQRRSERRSTV